MIMTKYAYKAKANDTFDSIALALFGNERYAPDLMSANPEHTAMTVFHGGEVIRIPVVDETDDSGLPEVAPWKE